MVKYQTLHTFANRNFARHGGYADWLGSKARLAGLVQSLITDGYRPTEPIEVIKIADADIEQAKEEKSEIARFYEDFETLEGVKFVVGDKSYSVSPSDVEAMYRSTSGKAAKFDVVSGFGRCLAIPIANSVRQTAGLSLIADIPIVEIAADTSPEERRIACCKENVGKATGVNKMSTLDTLTVLCNIAFAPDRDPSRSYENSFMRGGYLRGSAQKWGAIFMLNARFPDAKIIERLTGKPDNMPKLDRGIVRELAKDKETTLEQVVSEIDSPTRKAKGPKAASGKDITTAGDNMAVKIIAQTLIAASTNTLATINHYNADAAFINAAIDAITAGADDCKICLAIKESLDS